MTNKIVILFLFICTLSFGQTEKVQRLQHFDRSKIRYGFYLGIHQKGYAVLESQETSARVGDAFGFQLGVLADYNIAKNTSILLEPGVLSSSNTLTFGGQNFELNNTYFRFPVSLKLTTDRINNIRVFGTAGLSINYNFSADENNVGNGTEAYDFSLKTTTAEAEISIGLNIYLPYFKLSPAIKGVYGVMNELSAENRGSTTIAQGPGDIRSRAILFSLTFQ